MPDHPRLRRKSTERTEHSAKIKRIFMGFCRSLDGVVHWTHDGGCVAGCEAASQGQVPVHGGCG